MKTIIVQRGVMTGSDAVAEELEKIHSNVVVAEPEEYASFIRELGDDVGGFVFRDIDPVAQGVIRLIRNRRGCDYPVLPVAIVEDENSMSMVPGFGCEVFSAENLQAMGEFLSRPVELKVLLVEDDAGISAGLCQALRPKYRVRAEMDGAAGMAALKETRFDLAILDHRLPGDLSGLDLLREIKSRINPIPVIAMTAYDDDDREMTSYLEGADEYLAKPIHRVDERYSECGRSSDVARYTDGATQ